MRKVLVFCIATLLPAAAFAQSPQEPSKIDKNLVESMTTVDAATRHLREDIVSFATEKQQEIGSLKKQVEDLQGKVDYWDKCSKGLECWESIKPKPPATAEAK